MLRQESDGEKSKLKSIIASINDEHSTSARQVTSLWCTSTSAPTISYQPPKANITKLWSHQQLPTTIPCNKLSSSYIADCNDNTIEVPLTVLESQLPMMTATPYMNQTYKIQTRPKC